MQQRFYSRRTRTSQLFLSTWRMSDHPDYWRFLNNMVFLGKNLFVTHHFDSIKRIRTNVHYFVWQEKRPFKDRSKITVVSKSYRLGRFVRRPVHDSVPRCRFCSFCCTQAITRVFWHRLQYFWNWRSTVLNRPILTFPLLSIRYLFPLLSVLNA